MSAHIEYRQWPKCDIDSAAFEESIGIQLATFCQTLVGLREAVPIRIGALWKWRVVLGKADNGGSLSNWHVCNKAVLRLRCFRRSRIARFRKAIVWQGNDAWYPQDFL